MVSPESAAAAGEMVAARQQQLRADGVADRAELFRRQRQTVPAQLLSEEQTLGAEADDGRTVSVCFACRRRASRFAGATAACAAASARGNQQADGSRDRA